MSARELRVSIAVPLPEDHFAAAKILSAAEVSIANITTELSNAKIEASVHVDVVAVRKAPATPRKPRQSAP